MLLVFLAPSTEYSRSDRNSLLIFGTSDNTAAVLSGSEYMPGSCLDSTNSAELMGMEEEDIVLAYVTGVRGDKGINFAGLVKHGETSV